MEAPVKVEVLLNAPVKQVWSAITDKEKMKPWYFDLEEFIAADKPDFAKHNIEERWKYIIGSSLPKYFEVKGLGTD